MSSSVIKNVGEESVALPFPFKGILAPGQGAVIDDTAVNVIAALKIDSGHSATLRVFDLPDGSGAVPDTFRKSVYPATTPLVNGPQAGPLTLGTSDGTDLVLQTNSVERIRVSGVDGTVTFAGEPTREKWTLIDIDNRLLNINFSLAAVNAAAPASPVGIDVCRGASMGVYRDATMLAWREAINSWHFFTNTGFDGSTVGADAAVRMGTLVASGAVQFAALAAGVAHLDGSGNVTSAPVNLAGGASEVAGVAPVAHGGTGVPSITAHSVVVGEGAAPVSAIAPGTSGYPLVSQGAAADPAYAQLDLGVGATGTLAVAHGGTGGTTFAAHGVLIGEGAGALAVTSAMTNGQILVGATGADPAPKTVSGDATLSSAGALTLASTGVAANTYGDQADVPVVAVDAKGRVTSATQVAILITNPNLTAGLYPNITGVGTLTAGTWHATAIGAPYGGTGLVSPTAHSLLVAEGAANMVALGVAADGQIPIGSAGADPVLAVLTGTANQVIVTNGAGSITLSLPQNVHTGAAPTFAGLTITGAASISGGTITANATGAATLDASTTVTVGGASATITSVGRSGQTLAFFGAAGAVKTTVHNLTDNSGGASGGDTIAAVNASMNDADAPKLADTKNALATLAAKVNSFETALRNLGLIG